MNFHRTLHGALPATAVMPTPGATKGPQGEIIQTRTHSNGKYSVTIQASGAIVVKHGDWLSKYSAAIYNDFDHMHEFARRDKQGKLRPVHNLNLIFAGETLYHLPTYRNAHSLRMDPFEITGSPLSEEEKRAHIVSTLEADYHLAGERGELFEKIVHYGVHPTETALEIAEIAGLIAEGATVVTVAQLVAAVLTPITIGLAILNANETDKRIAGMQAIGYALAAWAFGQEIPQFPAQLRTNFSHFPGKQALPPVEAAWRETASKTVANIELEAKKKNRSVKSYQAFWRGLGEGDPKQVVRLVRDARAEELYGPEKVSFLALDPARYPN